MQHTSESADEAEPAGETPPAPGRNGIVAVVGRANVGKSTLINRIVGEKVSIVSPVAQTTRNMVRAIHSEERGQLVFLDTPGVHKALQDLGRIMNRLARASIAGSDVVLLVLDASTRPRDEDEGWMRRLARLDTPCLAALNKMDEGSAHERAYTEAWERAAQDSSTPAPVRWHRLSALTGEGLGELVNALFDLVPHGPRLFPDDVLTDFPLRLAIADVIREKLFGLLRDELPHAVAVRVDEVQDEGGQRSVAATVLVKKPSQKGIVLGHKGRLLRKVNRQAAAELTEMYEKPTTLEIWVKVEPAWDRNHFMLKQLGYV